MCVAAFFNVTENAFKFVIHHRWHFKWLVSTVLWEEETEKENKLHAFALFCACYLELHHVSCFSLFLLQNCYFRKSFRDIKSHYKFSLKAFWIRFPKSSQSIHHHAERKSEKERKKMLSDVEANWMLGAEISLHDMKS